MKIRMELAMRSRTAKTRAITRRRVTLVKYAAGM